jgi:hypothetical protein
MVSLHTCTFTMKLYFQFLMAHFNLTAKFLVYFDEFSTRQFYCWPQKTNVSTGYSMTIILLHPQQTIIIKSLGNCF